MKAVWNRNISTHDEAPAINLTPLIDIVFVILIMFIVIAPLLELDQIQLASGPSGELEKTLPVTESGQITIHVYEDNSIHLNNVRTSLELLPSQLLEEIKRHPEAIPQVFHDKKAHFGIYQGIKNAAETAGFSQIDIILLPSGRKRER